MTKYTSNLLKDAVHHILAGKYNNEREMTKALIAFLKDNLDGISNLSDDFLIKQLGQLGVTGIDVTLNGLEFKNATVDLTKFFGYVKTSFGKGNSLLSSLKAGASAMKSVPLGVIGKFTGIGGMIISGGEFVYNISHGNGWEALGNAGEFLMSASPLVAATGLGAPVAAGMFVVGAVAWGVSKYQTTDWRRVGDAIRSGWNALTGKM